MWRELEATGRAEVMAEGVAEDWIELQRSADVRYVGEGHEVPVAVPLGVLGAEAVDAMWSRFHEVHRETFGFEYEGKQDVELVNLRVQAIGQAHRPDVLEKPDSGRPAEPTGTRSAFWRVSDWIDCPLYDRDDLKPGGTLSGPLIVEEYGSTVVVPASWQVTCDRYGNLVLEKLS